GLCRRCFDVPAIRAKYSSLSPYGNRRRGQGCAQEDPSGKAPPAAEPTASLPGSGEKVLVMIERESRNETLWHALDSRRDDDVSHPPEWRAVLPDGEKLDGIFAISKSEARGMLKGRLGIHRRRRLPIGTTLERIT